MISSTHVVPATAPHTHTIIFLHGRGSDAQTFCNELFESQNSAGDHFTTIFPFVKWVFPCAKKIWAETDQEEMHQWFDIVSVQHPHQESEAQRFALDESSREMFGIIDEELEIVGSYNVFLGGISQGCALGIYTLLTSTVRIAGFIGLCGWMPKDVEVLPRGGTTTSFLLQHCEDDDTVPVHNGEAMRDSLRDMGFEVQWQFFEDGGHWLNEPEGMDGIVTFIDDRIKKLSTVSL